MDRLTEFPKTITDEELPGCLYDWQSIRAIVRLQDPSELEKLHPKGFRTIHVFPSEPGDNQVIYHKYLGKPWNRIK